eukprot:jgi/Botrbrau1/13833/Bobra.0056s0073.1
MARSAGHKINSSDHIVHHVVHIYYRCVRYLGGTEADINSLASVVRRVSAISTSKRMLKRSRAPMLLYMYSCHGNGHRPTGGGGSAGALMATDFEASVRRMSNSGLAAAFTHISDGLVCHAHGFRDQDELDLNT